MKKVLSGFLTLCLIVSLVLTLSACGGGGNFIGKWKTTVDLSELINTSIAAEDAEMAKYLRVDGFAVDWSFTFNKDGTYASETDDASAEKATENLRKSLEDGMYNYLKSVIQDRGAGISVEEALEASGQSMEQLMDEMMESFDMDAILADMNVKGKFLAEKGVLYTSRNLNEDVDRLTGDYYKFDGKKLVLTGPMGTDGDADESMNAIYPITFEKVD